MSINEGARFTGLAGQIIEAEKRWRREVLKADDAGISDIDSHPPVAAAVRECLALRQQVPETAHTLDDVMARAALLFVKADRWFETSPPDELHYSPTAQAFALLRAVLEFGSAPMTPLGNGE